MDSRIWYIWLNWYTSMRITIIFKGSSNKKSKYAKKNDTYSPHMDFVINLIFYFTTAFFWAITFENPSINDWMALIWNYQIKNQNMQKKRYLFATYGFCHKPHILLHNSFLLSCYFWMEWRWFEISTVGNG